ncbi:serine/threonine protein kinase [Actinocorallia herbida]|uniref:non-specific serine/threonine protein kinase n=2 Tax=Actinocorallia herbida TaxID=58109 RepID=A0A3N1D2B2_9ACTN|nr:serine/threonine protein kinase [Actinocorallia herbida]
MSGMAQGVALVGRYQLDALVGEGGMGEVWRATDLRLRRTVAVKVLARERASDTAARRRFEREAAAAAPLRHRGVALVFDSGFDETTRQLFIVMEFLEGEDLQSILDGHPDGLPPEIVRDYGAQLADALGAAHEIGVVHRDIKPANVMVHRDGDLKICDFGVARLAAHTGTLTQGAIGTPSYMAPEQLSSDPVDGRADLYALGCLLYALASGRPPFVADSVPAMLYKHLNAVPQPLTEVIPGFPADLSAHIAQLLAKDPADRPHSGRLLAGTLLGRAARNTVPTGRSAAPRSDPTLPSRRKRSRSGIAAAVSAAVAVATVATLGYALATDGADKTGTTGAPPAAGPGTPTPTGPALPPGVPEGWTAHAPATYQAPDYCRTSGASASSYLLDAALKPGSDTSCAISKDQYDDVAVSTTVTLTGTRCASFVLRRSEPFSYEFVICGDGGGFARKWTDKGHDVLTSRKSRSVAVPAKSVLTAVADSASLTLYLNGVPFHQATDREIKAGGIALGSSVLTAHPAGTLRFTKLTVWTPRTDSP